MLRLSCQILPFHAMDCNASSIREPNDSIVLIRRRLRLFAGLGESRPVFLARGWVHDALALGVKQVEIHLNAWWVVASDEDWPLTMTLTYGRPLTEFCPSPAA
jgi:hypothetical protein